MANFPKEFTEEELTEWLDTLDVHYSLAIIEKLFKDFRDYSLSLHDMYTAKVKEGQQNGQI